MNTKSVLRTLLAAVVISSASFSATAAMASTSPGRVTGIGGISIISKNPKALVAWYRDVLGVPVQPWGGAMFRSGSAGQPPYSLWAAFPRGSSEFAHSPRDFMLVLGVDNLSAFLARLKEKRVPVLKRESDPYGKYATLLDPDGTKIELWEPTKH